MKAESDDLVVRVSKPLNPNIWLVKSLLSRVNLTMSRLYDNPKSIDSPILSLGKAEKENLEPS